MYSSIMAQERSRLAGEDMNLFRSAFLPVIQSSHLLLRRQTTIVLREISQVLGGGISAAELPEYEDYRDPQHESEQTTLEGGSKISRRHTQSVSEHLERDGMRIKLDTETGLAPTSVRSRSPSPSGSRSATTTLADSGQPAGDEGSGMHLDPEDNTQPSFYRPRARCTKQLIQAHTEFRDSQLAVLADMLISGEMTATDDELRVEQPRSSMKDEFSALHERQGKAQAELKNRKKGRLAPPSLVEELHINGKKTMENEKKGDMDEGFQRKEENPNGHEKIVLFVASFMFLSGQFTRDLSSMHDHVVGEIKLRTKKRLHVHIFEQSDKNEKKDGEGKNGLREIPMYEALAALEGRSAVLPKRPKQTLASRFLQLEAFVRSDLSLGALKTTAAVSHSERKNGTVARNQLSEIPCFLESFKATVFATLLLAPSARAFFINYGLTGGVISVVVAMSPTVDKYYPSPVRHL